MNLLIAFATTDGMTETISEHIAARARGFGHRVTLLNMHSPARALEKFDAILVGASMHAGGYQSSAKRFIRAHLSTLNVTASAFFSVCLSQASRLDAERAEALRIARAFPAQFGWRPLLVQPVAGALRFSRYGLLRRFVMRRIARKEQPGIDLSHDHVFTDWDQVNAFLISFLDLAERSRLLEARTPRRVSASCQLVPDPPLVAHAGSVALSPGQ